MFLFILREDDIYCSHLYPLLFFSIKSWIQISDILSHLCLWIVYPKKQREGMFVLREMLFMWMEVQWYPSLDPLMCTGEKGESTSAMFSILPLIAKNIAKNHCKEHCEKPHKHVWFSYFSLFFSLHESDKLLFFPLYNSYIYIYIYIYIT